MAGISWLQCRGAVAGVLLLGCGGWSVAAGVLWLECCGSNAVAEVARLARSLETLKNIVFLTGRLVILLARTC